MQTWTRNYIYGGLAELIVTARHSDTSTANNSTKVTVEVSLKSKSNTSTNIYDRDPNPIVVKINGTTVSASGASFTYSIPALQTMKIGTWSLTVPHGSDGKKSVNIYVNAKEISNRWSATVDESFKLPDILRASTPTVSATSVALGGKVTVDFNRKSTNFRHKLVFEFTGADRYTLVTTAANVGSYTWTLPNDLANWLTSSTSNGGRFRLETYSGNTRTGTNYVSINVSIPNTGTFNPTMGSVSWEETLAAVKNNMPGVIVAGRSKIKFSGTAVTKFNATVKSIKLNFSKGTYKTSWGTTLSGKTGSATWDAGVGTWTLSMTVTDSRGRSHTGPALTITVTDYKAPTLTLSASRTFSEDGVGSDSGEVAASTNITVAAVANGTSLGGKNTLTLELFIKPKAASSWGSALNTTSTTSGSLSPSKTVYSGYLETEHYEVMVRVKDLLTGFSQLTTTVTATPTLLDAYKDEGIALGSAYSEALGGNVQLTGVIYENSVRTDVTNTWLPSGDGGAAYWRTVPQGRYWSTASNPIPGIPTTWAFVDIMKNGSDYSIMWYEQASGKIYRRSGNHSTDSGWVKIFPA